LSEVQALRLNREYTLPHPDPGVRLLRLRRDGRDSIQEYDAKLRRKRDELAAAARDLALVWEDVRRAARLQLGRLYDEANYAFEPAEAFGVSWKFVSLTVPSYLRHNVELHREEQARIEADLRASADLKEQELSEELMKLVDRLVERLEPGRLLDGRFVVISVKRLEDGTTEVRHRGEGGDLATKVLNDAELAARVKFDHRPKTFQEGTVAALQDTVAHVREVASEWGIGSGGLSTVAQRLEACGWAAGITASGCGRSSPRWASISWTRWCRRRGGWWPAGPCAPAAWAGGNGSRRGGRAAGRGGVPGRPGGGRAAGRGRAGGRPAAGVVGRTSGVSPAAALPRGAAVCYRRRRVG
jgi:hypothetical protein